MNCNLLLVKKALAARATQYNTVQCITTQTVAKWQTSPRLDSTIYLKRFYI